MLVSHRHRFIYTKTSKTGGTSVEAYFEPWCMPEGSWTPNHHRPEMVTDAGIVGYRGPHMPPGVRWYNHLSAQAIRDQVGQEIWDAYFKFCVIRNPFERAVSAFYFKRSIGMVPLDPTLPEPRQLERFLEGGGLALDRDKYLIDNKFCLDDFIRHERLAEDMARICARLGLPWEPSRLPRYKAGIRPPHASVEALFSDRSRQWIEHHWAPELKNFGYAFPG